MTGPARTTCLAAILCIAAACASPPTPSPSVASSATPSPSTSLGWRTFEVRHDANGAAACTAYTSYGVFGFLRGDPTDPEVVWLVDGSDRRLSIVWPAGFTARFEPQAALYDETGTLVARAGHEVQLQVPLTAAAGTRDDPYYASGLMRAGVAIVERPSATDHSGCHPRSLPPAPGVPALRTFELQRHADGTVDCDLTLGEGPFGFLRGDPNDAEVLWLGDRAGRRLSIVWPAGFTARFEPQAACTTTLGPWLRSGDGVELQAPVKPATGTHDDPYLAAGFLYAGPELVYLEFSTAAYSGCYPRRLGG